MSTQNISWCGGYTLRTAHACYLDHSKIRAICNHRPPPFGWEQASESMKRCKRCKELLKNDRVITA